MITNLRVVDNGSVAVVTATPDFNPLDKLASIASELKAINFKGNVVIDLFVRNGLSGNRFVSLPYDGRKFNRKLFSILLNVDESLKNEQDLLFRNNSEFVKESILSSEEVRDFLSG